MARPQLILDYWNIRELLKGPEVSKFLLDLGNDVANAAGSEYVAEVDNVSRKKRVVVNVKDPRRGALQREMASGRLARALGSVKK
jgi:hypothetical protein